MRHLPVRVAFAFVSPVLSTSWPSRAPLRGFLSSSREASPRPAYCRLYAMVGLLRSSSTQSAFAVEELATAQLRG